MPAIEIKPRPADFDIPDSVPRHWLGGDPVRTHLLDAFSCLLPAYEQFFISIVGRNKRRVKDPALDRDVRAFCVQEAFHSREHAKYNRWLLKRGYRGISVFERAHGVLLAVERAVLPRDWLLAMTAAGEHITAYMGHDFLSRPEKWSAASHPIMREIWSWHAVEETEHKAVCFDVYRSLRASVWLRNSALIAIALQTLGATTLVLLYLLWADGLLSRRRTWSGLFAALLGADGLFRGAVAEARDFFRRDFHPWQRDDRALISRWEASTRGAWPGRSLAWAAPRAPSSIPSR